MQGASLLQCATATTHTQAQPARQRQEVMPHHVQPCFDACLVADPQPLSVPCHLLQENTAILLQHVGHTHTQREERRGVSPSATTTTQISCACLTRTHQLRESEPTTEKKRKEAPPHPISIKTIGKGKRKANSTEKLEWILKSCLCDQWTPRSPWQHGPCPYASLPLPPEQTRTSFCAPAGHDALSLSHTNLPLQKGRVPLPGWSREGRVGSSKWGAFWRLCTSWRSPCKHLLSLR